MKLGNVLTVAVGAAITLSCASCRQPESSVKLRQFNGKTYKDGKYVGEQTVWPVKARVEITVADSRITDIQLSGHRTWKGRDAGPTIVKQILEKQSTKVDAVSGATMSSNAIMQATQKALDQAITK